MTTRSIATALALGSFAFGISFQQADAEPACQVRVLTETSAAQCQQSERIVTAYVKNGVMNVRCCCLSPTAILDSAGLCREPRPVKNIGKGSTKGTGETAAAIVAGCQKQGGTWDEQARRCDKPKKRLGKDPKACEAKGGTYDPVTGACQVKQAGEQSSSKKTEEQNSSEHSSDEGDDDYQPKKKKKQKRYRGNDND